MRGMIFFLCVCFLCGCGYRIDGSKEGVVAFCLPEIHGDETGTFNDVLIQELVATGNFVYAPSRAMVSLHVHVLSDASDRIVYRYDRDPNSGKLRKNLVGAMNARSLVAEVSVKDVMTEKMLWGPEKMYARADYDYIDPHSLHDLAFTGSNGVAHSVIDFSLGQLDSEGRAHIDAGEVAYRQLAMQIAFSLLRLPFFVER